MKKLYRNFLLVAISLFCFGLTSLRAQPEFDIGLFEKDPTTLEVRIRCNQSVTGLASNIAFTFRWDATTGTSLGALPISPMTGINFFKPSGERDNGGFRYQTFIALGFTQQSTWVSGTEQVVMEIAVASTTNPTNPLPINGFAVSNDAFVSSVNGLYYFEFSGGDRTGAIYNASPVFPIELMSFDAEKVSDHIVMVDWATSSEVNNDHFVVEKKRQGGSFEAIARVEGQGDSDEVQIYSFRDATEMAPVNYYRLKQVDTDGTFTYSDVVEVLFDRQESKLFTVFPSPAKDVAYLKSITPLDGDYAYYISDLTGRIVQKGVVKEDAPNLSATLDITTLPSGSYIVRTESPLGKVFLNRLLKQ